MSRTTSSTIAASIAALLVVTGVLVTAAGAEPQKVKFHGTVDPGEVVTHHVEAGTGRMTAKAKCSAADGALRVTIDLSSRKRAVSDVVACTEGRAEASTTVSSPGSYTVRVRGEGSGPTDYVLKVLAEPLPPSTSSSTTTTVGSTTTTTIRGATSTSSSTSTTTSTTVAGDAGTADCEGRAGDQTDWLQAKIDSTPDGGTLVVTGTCEVARGLRIVGRKGLTVKGDGILNGTQRVPVVGADDEQRQLRIQGGERITIKGLTILGAREGCIELCGSGSRDREHGIAIESLRHDPVTDVVVEEVTIQGVHGDFVYIGSKNTEADENDPRRITIRNSVLRNSGRQGIAVAGGDEVRIAGNDVADAGRTTFDFEAEAGGVRRVDIVENDIRRYDNAVINIGCADRGTGVPLNRGPITVEGNRIFRQPLKIRTSCPEVAGPPVLLVGENQQDVGD